MKIGIVLQKQERVHYSCRDLLNGNIDVRVYLFYEWGVVILFPKKYFCSSQKANLTNGLTKGIS